MNLIDLGSRFARTFTGSNSISKLDTILHAWFRIFFSIVAWVKSGMIEVTSIGTFIWWHGKFVDENSLTWKKSRSTWFRSCEKSDFGLSQAAGWSWQLLLKDRSWLVKLNTILVPSILWLTRVPSILLAKSFILKTPILRFFITPWFNPYLPASLLENEIFEILDLSCFATTNTWKETIVYQKSFSF